RRVAPRGELVHRTPGRGTRRALPGGLGGLDLLRHPLRVVGDLTGEPDPLTGQRAHLAGVVVLVDGVVKLLMAVGTPVLGLGQREVVAHDWVPAAFRSDSMARASVAW